MGYALQFAERRAFQVFAHTGMVEIDGVPPCGGVLFVDQLRDRNFGEIGIAHEVGAIVGGANGLAFFDLVGGEVASGNQASALVYGRGQFAGQRAVVKVVGVLGNALQGAREFGL